METGRQIKIQRLTATHTENIAGRKEVTIVSIQGWGRSNGRVASKSVIATMRNIRRGVGGGLGETQESLEPRNSGDRMSMLTSVAQNRLSCIVRV